MWSCRWLASRWRCHVRARLDIHVWRIHLWPNVSWYDLNFSEVINVRNRVPQTGALPNGRFLGYCSGMPPLAGCSVPASPNSASPFALCATFLLPPRMRQCQEHRKPAELAHRHQLTCGPCSGRRLVSADFRSTPTSRLGGVSSRTSRVVPKETRCSRQRSIISSCCRRRTPPGRPRVVTAINPT